MAYTNFFSFFRVYQKNLAVKIYIFCACNSFISCLKRATVLDYSQFDYNFAESTADKVSSQIINSDEEDVTQEADEPRIYKNPRNSPSSMCPRDEEQADLYVKNTEIIVDKIDSKI